MGACDDGDQAAVRFRTNAVIFRVTRHETHITDPLRPDPVEAPNDTVPADRKSLEATIQLELPAGAHEEMDLGEVDHLYTKYVGVAKRLMEDKNHDYGEAWRSMSQESFTDLILMKLQRIRQILSNEGKTLVSEGIDANYLDIINYAVFALILMNPEK